MQKTTYTKGLYTYNPTTYWQYIDWQDSSATVEGTMQIVDDKAVLSALDATTYTLNSIIEVSNDGSGRREWYQVQKIGDTQKFILVKKENATIEILDTLWQTSSTGYDSDIFDFSGFDNDAETEFEIIAKDLIHKIFSNAYESKFNTMFFNMLRYVLQEQTFVPWVQKTSESKFRLVSKGDIQPGSYNVENTQNTIDYYNETKPYHSKLDKELFAKHMFDMQNVTLTEIDGRSSTYGNALTHVANIQLVHSEVDSYIYEYTMVEDLHPSRPGRDLDYVKIPWNDFTSTMGGTTISWNPGSAIIAVYVNGSLRDPSTYEDMYMVDGRVVNFNSKLTAGDKVIILFNITKKYSNNNLHTEGIDISTNDIGSDTIFIYAGPSFDATVEPSTIFDGDAFTTLTDPTDTFDTGTFNLPTSWQNWNNEMVPSLLRETVEIKVQSNQSGSTVVTTGSTATRSWRNVIQDRENHQRFIIIEDNNLTLSQDITADATELTLSTSDTTSSIVSADATYSVNPEENQPRGITFNNDGTKMFIVGTTGDDVNEYTLSVGFDLSSTVTFVDSFSVSSQEAGPTAVKFNADGTKMFITGVSSSNVHEYALTTGFDVSTASFTQTLVTTVDNDNFGLDFKDDGTKMYITGNQNDKIYEYNLSSAFDISTATFNQDMTTQPHDYEPFGIEWSSDGTRLWIVGTIHNGVDEYSVGTPWDISTMVHVGFYFVGGNPSGIHISPDGTKMFIVGNNTDLVKSYTLATAYRLLYPEGIVAPTLNEPGGIDNVFYLDHFAGRIWIDNECIEFDKMLGTTLYNLRRGMLGTSAVAHTSGAKVRDANKLKEINVNRWESTNPLTSAPNQRDLGFPRIAQWNDLGTIVNSSTNDIATKLKDYHGTIT